MQYSIDIRPLAKPVELNRLIVNEITMKKVIEFLDFKKKRGFVSFLFVTYDFLS